jgi:hypothetical protein
MGKHRALEWRERAERLRQLAEETHDAQAKRQLKDLAERWERMAEDQVYRHD